MKKIFAVIIACAVTVICCTKDKSVTDPNNVSLITLDGASSNMIVSANTFTAADWLSVDYSEAADSIGWWVSDTLTNPYDTVPYYPGSDTTIHYPDTTVYYPGDTTGYPGGDTIVYYPPGDTTQYPHDTIPQWPGDSSYNPPPYDTSSSPHDTVPSYPHDTITYPPHDSAQYNNGFVMQANGKNIKIKINKRGSYTVVAFAYHKNTNGSYTIIKTGYVKLSAH